MVRSNTSWVKFVGFNGVKFAKLGWLTLIGLDKAVFRFKLCDVRD